MTGNEKDAGTRTRGRVIYSMQVSLDGYIAGPDSELDWAVVDEEFHRHANAQERAISAHLYGRRLYEVMRYWETADSDTSSLDYEIEYARIWQSHPNIVFSKTLERVEGNARLVREVSVEEVTRLKEEFGGDLSVGGAELASSFIRLGLIDEYQLYLQPVVLGSGKRFFPAQDRLQRLRLVGTRTFGSGVVFLRYQPVGEGQ